MTTGFASRTEAIYRQIVEAIEGSGEVTDARAEYDVDAIADVVLGSYGEGYLLKPEFGGLAPSDMSAESMEAFWDVVREHAL